MIIAEKHAINIKIKKILVLQLGDIGDVVWAIPTFRSVKSTFPEAELSIVTRKPFGDLLLDDSTISKVFQVDKKSFFKQLELLTTLRREKFDLLFDLRSDDRGAIMSFFSGAKMRGALYYPGLKWRNRAFTHLINPPPPKERILGAAEQSLKIVRGFGIIQTTSVPQIVVNEELRNKMNKLLAAEIFQTANGWVSINPFSRWSYKEWGMQKWHELVAFIWKKYKMPAIVLGSKDEIERISQYKACALSPIINFVGRTTLREMAALLQMSRLHIGVDSAAPQIAAAVGTTTLTIYGPSDWRDWAPPGDRNHVVLPDMDCSPCHQKGCNGSGRSECLETIAVAKVQDAVETMLDNDMTILKYYIEVSK
jgi:ADP-heptose:LPS heptosyltransferase